jgi:hypothetical protein
MTFPRMTWLTGACSIFSLFGNYYDCDVTTDGQAMPISQSPLMAFAATCPIASLPNR